MTIVINKGDATSRLAFEVLAAGAELAAGRPRFLGGAISAASSFFSAMARVSAAFARAAISAHRHRTPSAIQQHLLSQHGCPGTMLVSKMAAGLRRDKPMVQS